MTKKVCVVVGTRPEAIKMAPVYRQLLLTDGIEPILLSTGQHREMLAQTLDTFGHDGRKLCGKKRKVNN